jgi:hypothetical protein
MCIWNIRFEVHMEVTKDYCLLGCDAVYLKRKVQTFWRNLLPPSSVQKSKAAGSFGTLPSF